MENVPNNALKNVETITKEIEAEKKREKKKAIRE
jgi:hypothetical protein